MYKDYKLTLKTENKDKNRLRQKKLKQIQFKVILQN